MTNSPSILDELMLGLRTILFAVEATEGGRDSNAIIEDVRHLTERVLSSYDAWCAGDGRSAPASTGYDVDDKKKDGSQLDGSREELRSGNAVPGEPEDDLVCIQALRSLKAKKAARRKSFLAGRRSKRRKR